MKNTKVVELAIGAVIGVIGLVIAITAIMSQAPTVATLTNTATGSALANAGITSSSLPGTVYSFVNVFWALLPLLLVFGVGFAVVYFRHTGHK